MLANGSATAAEMSPPMRVSRLEPSGKAAHTGGGSGRMSATVGGSGPVGSRSATAEK
jgi:hypothetical protein